MMGKKDATKFVIENFSAEEKISHVNDHMTLLLSKIWFEFKSAVKIASNNFEKHNFLLESVKKVKPQFDTNK